MNVLIWFKRDLRVQDHHALCHAQGATAVLPLYIVEPAHWAQPDKSARQWTFTAECLTGLRDDLAALGAPLVVRVGDAVEVLARFCRQHRIGRILSHAEAGCPWSDARNIRVADWARQAGVEWLELAQTPEDTTPSALQPLSGLEPGGDPSAKALRLAEAPCPHQQIGGRAQGLMLLDSFLARRGEHYAARDCALQNAERNASRLSPYLATGVVSRAEVAATVAERQLEKPGGNWTQSLKSYQTRLHQKSAKPDACDPGGPGIDAVAFFTSDQDRLAAWTNGETGLPLHDAAMRYLNATGWLPEPARRMVVAFAATHLRLDMQKAGAALARRSTDYDPAIFWPALHSTGAGRTAGRYCDPIKLGALFDPTGSFTRRMVPELATVPDAFLHCPWRWTGAAGVLGRRYPEAVVDIASSARGARKPAQPPSPPILIEPMRAGFYTRPANRRAKLAPQAQLSLDF
jgi:deoxyribodipyrimidine photo-lyase